jgi:hypothetical protein
MLISAIRYSAVVGAALVLPLQGRAPTTTKYRIDQSLSQEVDATPAGGPKQKIAFTTSSFITVSLADSAGGKVMRVVVDSLRGDSAVANPAAVQIQGLLSDFFPWIKAGLKVGDSWSDTTAKTDATGSDSVTVRRVSAYKAAASETWNSRKAVRITEDFTSSVAGTQPTPNGPARIEGTGSGKGSYYVSPEGRYLGGDWEQQSSLAVTGSFAKQPLPITIVQKTKVTALK